MTNEEKQDWLKYQYPLTIITDRYDGTYSGGGWLAFPLYCDEIPSAVDGYDEECAAFWASNSEPVGKGNSAQNAIDNLISLMQKQDIIERNMNKSKEDLQKMYQTVLSAKRNFRDLAGDFIEASRQFLSRFLMDTNEDNPYICEGGWEILDTPITFITLQSMWQHPTEGIIYFKIDDEIVEFDDLSIIEIIQIIKLI